MAPSIALDNTPDFQYTPGKTLLLSPPSLSSQPDKLNAALLSCGRNATDLQMLDRLALGLVSLPGLTYDSIIILADSNDTFTESLKILGRELFANIVQSLKPGGYLRSQGGTPGLFDSLYQSEAILAGLVSDSERGFQKPSSGQQQAIPLQLGRKKKDRGKLANSFKATQESKFETTIEGNKPDIIEKPAGVGFIDFGDDLDPESVQDNNACSDEFIDEDTLLGDNDLGRPIVQPPECRPKAGKRRRACKDCTCGLSRKIEDEDAGKRANADKALDSMKLDGDDLAEVDFTVQGKLGSCGSCALGDAFRCEGCPYIGLPAFKPGEEVRLLNNDVQL
ncbi:electron carrier [Aspergillus chevalieri]|uniref:Electron carrier n=1 Tax=Aspergillus chevalieri TaxID=182096 RepID=A0A7R7VLR8_ASPCH|nr:electron carrier [Aspergillus chevalieri]BCR87027.1 electron carrier [Aspergillus chevalieri]